MHNRKVIFVVKNILIITICALCFTACNPIGEKFAEISLDNGDISTVENMSLKKGDVVTIWIKLAVSDNESSSKPGVKYNIETAGRSILFDSLNVEKLDHVINSKKTKESYNQSSSDGDSTVNYIVHEYETESKKFTAPADGNYTFDFKMTNPSGSSGFRGTKLSIILRKP